MNWRITVMMALAIILSLTAYGGETLADQSATLTPANPGAIPVKYSVVFAATDWQADGAKRLGELIDEKSEGRRSMEFHSGATLGDKIATVFRNAARYYEIPERKRTLHSSPSLRSA